MAALAAGVVLVAACGSGGAPKPAATSVPTPGPAWLAVLGQIQDDGTVDTQTALEAFSLAFAPLPGVQVPPGDPGTIASGTAALRWLVGHWKDIAPQQRAAAAQQVPELRNLFPPPPSSSGVGSGAVAASYLPTELTFALGGLMASQKRSDLFYTNFADQVAQDIGSRVGHTLGIPIAAHVGRTQKSTSAADTGVYTSSGGFSGTPGKCVITIGSEGDALSGDDLGAIIAHEVWHCFEGDAAGLASYWSSSGPEWVYEGEAEWVGASLYPGAPINGLWWPNYLNAPAAPLPVRSYTAIGFYSQLESSGVDVWSKLIPVVQAGDSASAFRAAGADSDQFLYAWAPGYLRDPSRGTAWDIVGPSVTADRATPGSEQVANGQSVQVSADPYANAIDVLDVSADVVEFSFSGHARVSDAAGNDYLIQGDVTLCHKDGGCECPDAGTGQAPLSPLETGVALAVTGDPGGNSGTITGVSLDDFCNRTGLTGTWVGTWVVDGYPEVNGGFTLTLTQKGTQVTGTADFTGPTCVTHGTVTGTLSGSHFTLLDHDVRDVTFEGTVKRDSMSTALSALACEGTAPAGTIVTATGRATRSR